MSDNVKGFLAAMFVTVGMGICAGIFFAVFPNGSGLLGGLFMIAVFFSLVGFAFVIFNGNWRMLKSRVDDQVVFDECAVTRTRPDGIKETVRWDELKEVGILTTDEGPLLEDVFWMLLGDRSGCAIPAGAKGMTELLPRLQQLPGFDNATLIKAMGSTSNAKFVCWTRVSASTVD